MSQGTAPTRQLLIIDSQVKNWQSFASDVGIDTLVLILDSSSDGLTQISDYLTSLFANSSTQDFAPLQSIQIISHDSAGSLLLGSTTLNSNNLDHYASQLATMGNALSENGDLLLYGCNVAADQTGLQFIKLLADLTKVDVAASNDSTGSAVLGGDWQLESATGTIDASLALSTATLNSYTGILAANTAPSFAIGDGKVITDYLGYGKSVILQTDGKILLGGSSAVVRYNSNGSLDTSFGSSGIAMSNFVQGESVTVQVNGKILLGGFAITNGYNFALVRYNSDGSIDNSFGNDGKVNTNVNGPDDLAFSVAVQADGNILLGGYSSGDFAMVRYTSNGSLDRNFGGDGKITTSLGAGSSVVVLPNNKILLGGSTSSDTFGHSDFALVRYNGNGSLDVGFDHDGKVSTNFSGVLNSSNTSSDGCSSIAVQADGKILLGGNSHDNGSPYFNLAVVRYNSDGSLDRSFGGDGKVITSLSNDYSFISIANGESIAVQEDGKILLGGNSGSGGKRDFIIVRYNSNGSLDANFGKGGIVTTNLGGDDIGESLTVQADGKILVAGSSNGKFAIARYNTDGSLDTSFHPNPINTFNSNPNYPENGTAVVLYNRLQIYDPELANLDNYNGASIALARHGGANSQDVISGSGNLNFSVSNASLSGITIGTLSNSNGTLTINFNSNATQERVNKVLSSLAYSNISDDPPTSVQIDWTFSDGNTGEALTALGSTVVNIKRINDAPVITMPTAISYVDTVFADSFATVEGKLIANDAESSPLTYGITGGTDNGNGTFSKSSLYGVFTVTKATGAYSFVANDAAIEPLKVNASISFKVTVSDGSLSDTQTLTVNIAQKGTTESIGNDTLTGTSANDRFDGLAGNDIINGLTGADTMSGGLGNDVYIVDNTGDVVNETSILATGIDSVNSSVSYTLTANVENLTLTGTTPINGVGNALNNVLTGNAAANILKGLSGNDIYVVDNIGDIVTETSTLATEIDRVNSSISYTLTANVENLTLTGTAPINGVGNAVNNILTGNAAANTLKGLAGNDIYVVDNTGDVVTETSTLATEIDSVNSSISYTLTANVENLTLTGTKPINGTGNALHNVLIGNTGANTLNGGAGADKLVGGLGRDIYVVDNTGDVVIETLTQPTEIDSVNSSISYTLRTNVENLILTGTAAINGIGNSSANTLIGNTANNSLVGYEGNDTLSGGAGNDTLNGVTGNDTLTGGAGNDVFRFSTAPTSANVDKITDFTVINDTVQLENAIFNQLVTTGVLNAAYFVKAAVATDLNDYVIYNAKTGALLYDADGNNTGAAVQIAVLGVNLGLTNADFVVI